MVITMTETNAAIPAMITAIHWIVSTTTSCSCSCPPDLSALERLLSNFDNSRSVLEDRFGFSTFWVVVGVGLELVVVPFEYWDDWQEYRKSLAEWMQGAIPRPQRPLAWIVFLEVLGAVFVAGGVTGELRYEGKIRCVDNQIRQAEDARANLLERKHDELEKRMVDIFGPRHLTVAQSANIAKELSPLRNVKVDVYLVELGNSFTSSDDSLGLGRDMVRTLRAAHLDAEGWQMRSCLNGVQVKNVIVFSANDERQIASRILGAIPPSIRVVGNIEPLTKTGLPACPKISELDPSKPNTRAHDAKIKIVVGAKIQPILTQEMLEPTEEKK